MTYPGHVRRGKLELDGDVRLPEGAAFELRLAAASPNAGWAAAQFTNRAETVRLFEEWCTRPKGRGDDYWDEVERDLVEHRLSFGTPESR